MLPWCLCRQQQSGRKQDSVWSLLRRGYLFKGCFFEFPNNLDHGDTAESYCGRTAFKILPWRCVCNPNGNWILLWCHLLHEVYTHWHQLLNCNLYHHAQTPEFLACSTFPLYIHCTILSFTFTVFLSLVKYINCLPWPQIEGENGVITHTHTHIYISCTRKYSFKYYWCISKVESRVRIR